MASFYGIDNNNKWMIVEFAENKAVEAIPDFWIRDEGKKVVWPPFDNAKKCIHAIASRKDPDISWKLCDISRIFGEG